MQSPISVCMIARNEERWIATAIRSVLPHVREVIVLDTGSTDRTAQEAAEAGARVVAHQWKEDFSEARNAALALAGEPFILMLDADEVLDAESAQALGAYCAQSVPTAGRVIIRNLMKADGEEASVTELTRLFPNLPGYRYHGRIHEQLLLNGQAPPVCTTGVALTHYGYLQDALRDKDKVERNARLLLQELADHPRDPYAHYQLGKTYAIGKRPQEAAEHLQLAIDLLAEVEQQLPPYVPALLVRYAYVLLELREFPRLFEIVSIGVDLFPDFTDLYFVYGVALVQAQDARLVADVPGVFAHCLQLGEADPQRYETVSGVGSFKAHHNLGVYHEVTGDRERALLHYRTAAASGYQPSQARLHVLLGGEPS